MPRILAFLVSLTTSIERRFLPLIWSRSSASVSWALSLSALVMLPLESEIFSSRGSTSFRVWFSRSVRSVRAALEAAVAVSMASALLRNSSALLELEPSAQDAACAVATKRSAPTRPELKITSGPPHSMT